VNAPRRNQFKDDEHQKENAEAGDGSSCGWKSDAIPGESPESCSDEAHCCDQDEALMGVGLARCPPRGVDNDGEPRDAEERDG